MKIKILDYQTLGEDIDLSCVKNYGDVEEYPITFSEDVPERISDADVLILNKVKLNRENLPYAKNLKLICITATGFDNVDTEYCKEHNIAVCNVSGYSTESVVQLTLAMALNLSVNLTAFDKYSKSGAYTKSGVFNCLEPTFHELYGKTWGIVGLGSIGKRVATIAKAMGLKVLAYKRTPVDDFECVSLKRLLKESDVVSLHTPLNDGTYHLINSDNIGLMKNNAILINVARGAVVDEDAVTNAVLEDKIGGFATDVYSTEPMQASSPYQKLLDRDNCIFTPHMAWGAVEARERCIDEVCKNIDAFQKGEKRSRIV